LEKEEQNYFSLDKEIKEALNVVNKFEIFLINKKFMLRIDAATMNKVLNKEVKKERDAKFATWRALFSNFDFDIEHVKGNENSIPNFLSREHFQASVITSEPDQ
jgi:hypothetical protein